MPIQHKKEYENRSTKMQKFSCYTMKFVFALVSFFQEDVGSPSNWCLSIDQICHLIPGGGWQREGLAYLNVKTVIYLVTKSHVGAV